MKFPSKKVLAIVFAFILAGAGVYYFVLRDSDKVPQVQEFPSADDIPADQTNDSGSNDEQIDEDGPVKPELEKPAATGTASVTLSFAEQQDSSIVARAFAESDGPGSCELKLTKGSQEVTKTSGSALQTSYYQCDGFEFSVNDVPSSGTWTAVVTFVDGSGARSNSNAFEFEVTK